MFSKDIETNRAFGGMRLREWERLPEEMQKEAVRPYYEILKKKTAGLIGKRLFDLALSAVLLVFLLPVFAVVAVWIKLDSPGPVLFCQVRVTQYGRKFKIYKFRSMEEFAEKKGTQVTTKGDARVTRAGKILRNYRLDELPQLLNILKGEMTFVGTRPEVEKYVAQYTDEMLATLLLPAGVTSQASIEYKDEEKLLEYAEYADKIYVEQVLPEKMSYNLAAIRQFGFRSEIKTMLKTIGAVAR